MLFGEYGLCGRRSVGSLPISHTPGMKETYFDCGPLTPIIFANTSLLDVNHDALWKEAEAEIAANEWGTKYNKVVQLPRIFEVLMKKAKDGSLLMQQNRSDQDWSSITEEYTALPLWLIEPEQQLLRMCAVSDDHLCGNLEVRGILAKSLPSLKSEEDRLLACQHFIGEECKEYMGEVFRSYKAWGSELCGNIKEIWDPKRKLMTAEFKLAHRYRAPNQGGSKQGVSTWVFQSFLMIILLIWWMSVFTEMREILDWWVVLLVKPTRTGSGRDIVVREETDESIVVITIPWHVKAFNIAFNLFPRTCICIAVSVAGSDFLISSDDYMDLILNSVALTFLIQIDEMLYAALLSTHEKESVAKVGSIKAAHPSFEFCDTVMQNLPMPIVRAALMILLCAMFMAHSYAMKGGKYDMAWALSCLCQAEGDNCLASQFLGGVGSVIRAS
eukprot:TRINITY_DN5446_c0_g1_i5.p1 TRINITY_DN5446_c0_g1~~TRINITY_DN5446_c0_g1_i5.p1  ORF type:complete len:443 (-),score=70.37 TRINITY_DN5446_c0_g1_i5:28-1356(-)